MEKHLGRNSRGNGHTRYTLQTDIDKIRHAVEGATRHVKGRAQDMIYDSYDNLVDKSNDIQHTVVQYTKKKPFKSLGIAVLAGLFIGFVLRK